MATDWLKKSLLIEMDFNMDFSSDSGTREVTLPIICDGKVCWYVGHSSTHWGRVTHICVHYLTIIDSDNGLSPGRCQAIIWTNAAISLIGHLGTNFFIQHWKQQENAFESIVCEMAATLSQPQCVKQFFSQNMHVGLLCLVWVWLL